MINTIKNFIAEVEEYIKKNNYYDEIFEDYSCPNIQNDAEYEALMSKKEYRMLDKELVDRLIRAAYEAFYGKPEEKEMICSIPPERYVLWRASGDTTLPETINHGALEYFIECNYDKVELANYATEQEALAALETYKNDYRKNGNHYGDTECIDVEIYGVCAICGDKIINLFRAEWEA